MIFRFRRSRGPIRVRARIEGPTGRTNLVLALDTGAVRSLISVAPLVSVGYDPTMETEQLEMTTASGIVYVPLMPVQRLRALGKTRVDFEVIAHTLPPSAGFDGLLGLDFLREYRLGINFLEGEISLE